MIPKPHDYRARRQWQDAARARGEIPECGREACTRPASPAWVGSGTGTELIYCEACATEINKWNPGTCRPEVPPSVNMGGETRADFDAASGLSRAQRRLAKRARGAT